MPTSFEPRLAPVLGTLLPWMAAAIALWVGAAAVCPGGACQAGAADRQILAALHAWRAPALDAFFVVLTWLGSMLLLLPAALTLAWRWWRQGRRAAALLLPASLGGAWAFAHLGKTLVDRPRPDLFPALIAMPADLSFPSAHAMQITAFALAWLLAPGARRGWRAFIAAALAVFAVASSRLYLQVHFPSDVLIGILIATGWVIGLRVALAGRP